MTNCLACYQPVQTGPSEFHPRCARRIFGTMQAPLLPYSEDQMLALAEKVIQSQVTVPGAQPKLSLELEVGRLKNMPPRFTIVGLWGEYILKPPAQRYPHLPEIEDLTMHLAELSQIATVPHSLIRLSNGGLAYITRRIDRRHGRKMHMEDMAQLTHKLTEQKYIGSYEQVGKAIIRYSANPFLDLVNFFEVVVFSFLTGNADMHLKNFSLIKQNKSEYVLSPAYDLVASALVMPGDAEELALSLQGKKNNIQRSYFIKAMQSFNLNDKTIVNLFSKFCRTVPQWQPFIGRSFLPSEMKSAYISLVLERLARLA